MPRRKKSSDDESESPEDDSEEETKKKKRKAPAKRAKKDTSARGKKGKADEEDADDVEDEDMEPSDGYASDLMGDEADRKHLASLPQVQRENIIYERSLKRQERKERMEARKKFRATQKKQEAPAKPARKAAGRRKKADSEEEDESEESEDEKEEGEDDDDESGRTRGKRGASQREKQSSALSDLRARRNKAETSKEPSAEDRDRERREQWKEKEPSPKEASEDEKEGEDSESESEDDRDRRRRHRRDERDDETDDKASKVSTPVTLNEIVALQMRRFNLDKLVNEPYFEEYVTGTFVRVGIGNNSSGVPVYRCCEVFGVQEANRNYKIINTDTKLSLLLRYGKAERLFKMHLVSNSKITQAEFDAWVAACQKDGVDVVSKEEATRKRKNAERLRKNFVYTPEAISAMIRAKNSNSFRKLNTTLERSKLESERAKAEELGDQEALAKLQQRLDDLDEYEAKLKRQMSKGASIVDLNKRAMMKNNASLDKVSKAEAAASTQPLTRDPFRRRRTAPVLTWVGARPISEEEAARKAKEDEEKAEKERRDKEKKEAAEREKKKGLPVPVASVEELVKIAAVKDGKEELTAAQQSEAALFSAGAVDPRARDPDWQMLHDAYSTLPLHIDLEAQPAPRPLRVSRPVEPPRHVTKFLTLEEYEMRFAEEY